MSENNDGVIFTPKPEEEGRIDELPVTDESPILTPEEIEKFSPKVEEIEGANEGVNEGISEGANEGVSEEPKELTEEEKREIFITALKQSKIRFRPIKNLTTTTEEKMVDRKFGGKRKVRTRVTLTNVTVNPYGTAYKQERKRKNRLQKKSRKLARKG